MPPIARLAIRLAFVSLLLSWLVELWCAAAPLLSLGCPFPRATSYHLFFVGWLTQMIFGVAFWLFPTQGRQNPRGNEKIAAWAIVLLNGGLCLRLLCEPMQHHKPGIVWGVGLLLAGLAQWLSAALFTSNIWRRIIDKSKKAKADAAS